MSMYLRALAALFSLACCQTAVAVTINTWVDDQGVRHFSQFPPTDGEQAVDTLELETPRTTTESATSQDRIQTILDVARDLEDSRLHREQQRADQAAANAAAQPAPPEFTPEPDAIFLPYPTYPYPPAHYPHWKHKQPKPEHPDGRRPDPPRSRIHKAP